MGTEIWKPIVGYEGYYEVSNHGRVRSVDREVPCKNGASKKLRGRIMAQSMHYRNGYKSVILTIDSSQKRFLVHRLVASAFIKNPHNYDEVNHKDENRVNNHIDNLEWCSHAYNNRYGTKRERLSALKNKPVKQMLHGEIVSIWPSATIAAKSVDGVQSGVSDCCNGRLRSYKGYEWAYA